jgi:hypothetical protein
VGREGRQGTSGDTNISSDEFLQAAIDWFRLQPEAQTAGAKVQALVHYVRRHKVLLVLDGLEPLQDRSTGDLYEYPAKSRAKKSRTYRVVWRLGRNKMCLTPKG